MDVGQRFSASTTSRPDEEPTQNAERVAASKYGGGKGFSNESFGKFEAAHEKTVREWGAGIFSRALTSAATGEDR
jgi:hypothetical protein